MNADRPFWQARYRQQVGWTASLRRYALAQTGLPRHAPILEVGCGYGALLDALHNDGYTRLTGADIDLPALQSLPAQTPSICADGLALPFPSGSFDACLCHFFLLWVKDPLKALLEMKRVTHPGGWLLALAEPDYGARLDEPAELKPLGILQTQALVDQGAHPFIGAHLAELFQQPGLTRIESGMLEQSTDAHSSPTERELEWAVLAADLKAALSSQELERWQALEQQAWASGTRRLHVPVHFAFGQIPA